MSKRIPAGWLQYPKYGEKLIVDKFLSFKTPLDKKFDRKLEQVNRFYPEDVFEIAKRDDYKLGLWIDLTNTSKYYSKEDIEHQGCRYEKINCEGHGAYPTKESVSNFIKLVDTFVSENPTDCIAIHCTHGLNRTGFFIVSLLVEKWNFPVEEAIEIFQSNRPPGIIRREYVEELRNRYTQDDQPVPQTSE